jgi:hypothetical protein
MGGDDCPEGKNQDTEITRFLDHGTCEISLFNEVAERRWTDPSSQPNIRCWYWELPSRPTCTEAKVGWGGQPANYEAIGDQFQGFGYGMKEKNPNKPPQNIMSRNLLPTSEREKAKLAIIPDVDPCQSPLLVSSPFCWYFVVSYIQTPIFVPEIPSGRGTARSFRRRQSDPQQLLWVSWQVVIAMAIVGDPPAGPVLRLQWLAATSSKPLCELTSSSATARKNGRLSVSEGS